MRIMQYVLFIIDKLNLLVRKFASKSSRDRIIPRGQSKQDEIDNSKGKSIEDKSVKEKSIYNINVDKIMRIDNAFSTNILMFCDRESKMKA